MQESIVRFLERELIFRLNQHPAWKDTRVSLGSVRLGPTRIVFQIICLPLGTDPMQIFFEMRGGWILAGIEHRGWADALEPNLARLLSAALVGLYKAAGVEIVKEQIERLFVPHPILFELSPTELTVWTPALGNMPTTYDLSKKAPLSTVPTRPYPLLLTDLPVTWDAWVKVWDFSATESVRQHAEWAAIGVLPAATGTANER